MASNLEKMYELLGEEMPPQVKKCVISVAPKTGGDLDRSFGICVKSMQKSGQLKKGTTDLTKKGSKSAKTIKKDKDFSRLLSTYEKLLKKNRKK